MTLRERQVVALDVDGVVLDLEHRWSRIAAEVLAREPVQLNDHYHMARRFGLSEREVADVWSAFFDCGGWGQLEPFPGAVEAVHSIQQMGMSIAFVTGIPEAERQRRDANLRRLGFRDFTLYCTGSATESKRPVLSRIGAKFFVDDRLRHLRDAWPVVPNLVWIDLGDHQEVAHHEVPARRFESLAQWSEGLRRGDVFFSY